MMWAGRVPRVWQAEALPCALAALDAGRRSIVRAATGSGKSALQGHLISLLVPRLALDEVIVVTVPTQHLTEQLAQTIAHHVGDATLVSRYYERERELASVIVTCHASLAPAQEALACPECSGEVAGARELEGEQRATARAIMVAWAMDDEAPTPCQRLHEHRRACALAPDSGLVHALREAGLRVAYWIADECHKTACGQVETWARWSEPARQLGFTATPWRSGESDRLTRWDDLAYDYGPVRAIADGVILAPEIVAWGGDRALPVDDVALEMIATHLAAHPGPGVVSAASVADAIAYAERLRVVGVRAEVVSYRDRPHERARRLDALRDGEIDALVYCSLLAEGVDLPWLEWLCLRRTASSRVRLPQEVGRVIRTHPGKRGAWVLDPGDAFGRLSLDYLAVLGEDPYDPLDALARDLWHEVVETQGSAPTRVRAVKRSCAQRWLREVVMRCRLAGWTTMVVKSTAWRPRASSAQAVAYARRLIHAASTVSAARALDETTRALLRIASAAALRGDLDAGSTSDLIDVLIVLGERRSYK